MRAHPRGFSLAELLVGLVVTSIVMTAVVAVVLGIQQSYQADTETKVLTENGRTALDYLERTVAMAGYGVDPRIAFDVSAPGAGNVAGFNGAVVTDDLGFRYRDPSFGTPGTYTGGSLTVPATFASDFPVGTLFAVTCTTPQADGTFPSVYVRTTAVVTPTSTTVTAATAADPYTSINTSSPCVTTNARVFLVHENRVRVVNINNRPWLVRFRSLEGAGDPTDAGTFEPIAPDVENFQVAFAMAPPADGGAPLDGTNRNNIIGDGVAGDAVLAVLQPANPFSGSQPSYTTPYNDALRRANVPANIRAVHLALSIRSSRAEPTGRRAYQPEQLFDGRPDAGFDGFTRSTFHTVVPVINMMSRTGFLPALRSDGVPGDANFKGG